MTLSSVILKAWVRQWVERKRIEEAQSALLLEALREVQIDVSPLSHLSDDITVRILSHCTTTDLKQCLFVDRRLSRLVLEQRNSAAIIHLRTKYSEIKQMFPSGPRFWANDAMQAEFYTMLWPEAEMVIRSVKRRQDIAERICTVMSIRGDVSASDKQHCGYLFIQAFGTCSASPKWVRMGVWLCQLLRLAQKSGYTEIELFGLLNYAPTIALLCLECFLGQQAAVDKLMHQLSRYPQSTAPSWDSSIWFDRKEVTCDAILCLFLTRGTCGIQGDLNTEIFKRNAEIITIGERAGSPWRPQPFRLKTSPLPEGFYDSFYAKTIEAKTPDLPRQMPRFASFISCLIVRRVSEGYIDRRTSNFYLHIDLLCEELESRARGGEVEQLMAFCRSFTSIAFIDMIAKRGMNSPFRAAREMAENAGDDDRERRLPYEVGIFEDA